MATTFLSPSVRTLLNCASFTIVPNDHLNKYLTNDATFKWDNIGVLINETSANQESADWTARSNEDTVSALVPVFDAAERLCENAVTTTDPSARTRNHLFELWKWTGKAHELSKCLTDSFGPSTKQTSAVESMLIISAILERAVGNILRRENLPVPFLLRDLLLEKTLFTIFGEIPVQFTRLLIGMPSLLNARNLVWHGFVAPNEMSLRIPATLLILLASLGKILNTDDIPQKNKSILGIEEFPEVAEENIDGLRYTVSRLSVIPHEFLPYWDAAFELYTEQQFGRCLTLLLPQLELVLRIGFCNSNDCPKRLLTAVQSAPHATLDDILVETIDGKPNNLREDLGDGLLNALFDLLQRPAGPRIRDRLGHGECSLSDIPHNLAALLLSLSTAVAARLSKVPSTQFWDGYKARFHPTALLRKTAAEVLDHIERLHEATKSFPVGNYEDLKVGQSLEEALTDGDADSTETARRGLCDNPSWSATLFRPRPEIIATVALIRTLRSVCVGLEATSLKISSLEIAEGRLRSRQRKTLQRIFQNTPALTKTATCLVLMAIRIKNDVTNDPHQVQKWHKCLSRMEKYTDRLESGIRDKNRWEEVKILTSRFCEKILPFFKRP